MNNRNLIPTLSGQDIEVDYDYNPTDLYLHISDSDWYQTLHSIEGNPFQARIWVVKTENRYKLNQSQCRFLPLHSACAREPPLSVVSALLKAYPEGATKRDDNGMCPLHYATANHASAEVVKILIEYHPEALFQRIEPSGALPIHLAAQWGVSSIEVMECLLENNNSLASARDAEGLCPLEIAIDAEYRENKVGIINLLRDSMLQETLERSSTLTSSKSEEGQEMIQIDCSPTQSSYKSKSKHPSSKRGEEKLNVKSTVELKKQISKLRNGCDYIKSSVEEQITLEWEAVHIALGEVDQKIYDKEYRLEKESIQDSETRNDDDEIEIKAAEIREDNVQLENEIKKLDKVCKKYRTKIDAVESIMKTLANTISSMAKNHSMAMSRLKKREQDMLRINRLRAEKLTELAQEIDAVTMKLSTFDYAEEEKKAYSVMKKEQEVLEKMSEIIQALKS